MAQPHGIAVQLQQHPAEPGELRRGGGRAAEVGIDALHLHVGQVKDPLHVLHLLRQEAEATKAGVHRQVDPGVHMQGVDGLSLGQALHREDHPPLEQGAQQRRIVDAAHQQQLRVRLCQLQRLLHGGAGEQGDALLRQQPAQLLCAQAVAVALENGDHLTTAGIAPVVGQDGPGIDE